MKYVALLFIALAAGAAVACGSSGPEPTATAPRTPIPGYIPVLEQPTGNVPTPDFTLPSATGGTVSLSEFRGERPVAVVFYRGFF